MQSLSDHPASIVNNNLLKLAAIFPECVITKQQNGCSHLELNAPEVEKLFGSSLDEMLTNEHQFLWSDKKRHFESVFLPTNNTLRPITKESRNFASTQNVYIKGDNLEVLKVLSNAYSEKIKVIYIDPPYNTGKDYFVYSDNFAKKLDEFKVNNEHYDNKGYVVVQNTESNGRFHSDWLNMMYPRLKASRELLTKDGVIFISIDDHEVANLKKIADEIFGASNFVATICCKRRGNRADSKYYAVVHEYILCYARSIQHFSSTEEIRLGEIYPHFDKSSKLFYKTKPLLKTDPVSLSDEFYYSLKTPDNTEVYPEVVRKNADGSIEQICVGWKYTSRVMLNLLQAGRIEFTKTDSGWMAYEKVFAPKDYKSVNRKSCTWFDDIPSGTKRVKELFNDIIFDYPKSDKLIKRLLNMVDLQDNDIVLDFFAGSATTADAVMQLNVEEDKNLRFILVQANVEINSSSRKALYEKLNMKTICDIGLERIRRAGDAIVASCPPLDTKLREQLDIGFRVFELASSNLEDYSSISLQKANSLLFADCIKQDRSSADLLVQTMLTLGIELSSSIQEYKVEQLTMFNVQHNCLIACFEDTLSKESVMQAALLKPKYFAVKASIWNLNHSAELFSQIFAQYSPQTEVILL